MHKKKLSAQAYKLTIKKGLKAKFTTCVTLAVPPEVERCVLRGAETEFWGGGGEGVSDTLQ